MPRDKTRIALNALIGLIIVTAVSTLAYRYYYYGGADERAGPGILHRAISGISA